MAKQEVEIYVPQLPSTAGWVAMTQSDREWLQEHTSAALSLYRESGLKALQFCVELASIQNFLEGKSMTFTNWVRSCFGSSERTAYNWLESYKKLLAVSTEPAILSLAQEGLAGVQTIKGPRELLPVLKALPAPKSADKKGLETWREKVSQELRSRRSKVRKRVPLKLDKEDSLRSYVVTTRRLIRECGLETSADVRAWLKRGGGYLFQMFAVSGSITVERTPIPDGWLPQVGRPKNPPPAHKSK